MAYIYKEKQVAPKNFHIVDSIRVNKDFLHRFDLVFGNLSFFDVYFGKHPTVGDLIDWMEGRIRNEDEQGNVFTRKYDIRARAMAVDKVLPKLRQWERDSYIDIHDF